MKALLKSLVFLAVLGMFAPCASANTYSGDLKVTDYELHGRVSQNLCYSTSTYLEVSIEGSKISLQQGVNKEIFSTIIASDGSFSVKGRAVKGRFIESFNLTGVFNGKTVIATYTKVMVKGHLTCVYSLVASPR